ncbi:MAG: type III pantothenate kinase [Lewinellaceae bacterium]|nr:type III pantothenate kinase [Lewinellaceae bacterium]
MPKEGNLVFDVGNSRIKAGYLVAGSLRETWVWDQWDEKDLDQLVTNQNPENIIFSSVGWELPNTIAESWRLNRNLLELTAETPLPIRNAYRTPQTLGRDRLAAVVGAFALFPGEYCLVVDAGTCITFDFLEGEGVYRGGNIAPGIRMRLQAMHTFTARLPQVAPGDVDEWIGYSTESALRNGAVLGATLEIRGYEQWATQAYGKINVLLTGGDAEILAKNLKSRIFVNHNLVLLGLNKILDYNVASLE